MYGNVHAQPCTSAEPRTQLVLGKMSRCREDVYLAGTDLMAWRGRCSSVPFSMTQRACVCVLLIVMCVVFDWRGTMGDASVPRGAQPDAHRIWHCQASGVTAMWQGRAGPKWLLRLHYPAKTLDTPSPISHFPFMVTEPFTIHKWRADCTLPFAQYRLITHRCKLARSRIRQPPSPTANQREELSGVPGAGQQRWWLSWRKHQLLVFTLPLYPLMFWHWRPLESESICQKLLWEAACWRWPKMNVSLAETQISIRGVERVKEEKGRGGGKRTAAALGQGKEKLVYCCCVEN